MGRSRIRAGSTGRMRQPTIFELAIDLATATALGNPVQSVPLTTADEAVE